MINDTNRAAACLVEYVNKVEKKEFTSLEEMKTHMAKEAESHNGANDGDTSEAEYDDENALEEALRETAILFPFVEVKRGKMTLLTETSKYTNSTFRIGYVLS